MLPLPSRARAYETSSENVRATKPSRETFALIELSETRDGEGAQISSIYVPDYDDESGVGSEPGSLGFRRHNFASSTRGSEASDFENPTIRLRTQAFTSTTGGLRSLILSTQGPSTRREHEAVEHPSVVIMAGTSVARADSGPEPLGVQAEPPRAPTKCISYPLHDETVEDFDELKLKYEKMIARQAADEAIKIKYETAMKQRAVSQLRHRYTLESYRREAQLKWRLFDGKREDDTQLPVNELIQKIELLGGQKFGTDIPRFAEEAKIKLIDCMPRRLATKIQAKYDPSDHRFSWEFYCEQSLHAERSYNQERVSRLAEEKGVKISNYEAYTNSPFIEKFINGESRGQPSRDEGPHRGGRHNSPEKHEISRRGRGHDSSSNAKNTNSTEGKSDLIKSTPASSTLNKRDDHPKGKNKPQGDGKSRQ